MDIILRLRRYYRVPRCLVGRLQFEGITNLVPLDLRSTSRDLRITTITLITATVTIHLMILDITEGVGIKMIKSRIIMRIQEVGMVGAEEEVSMFD